MGSIIKLSTELLVPSQDYLMADSLRGFFRNYEANPGGIIVPVRNDIVPGKFVLLDGHHASCVADIYNGTYPESVDLYGWVAESENDFISGLDDGFYSGNVRDRNEKISLRWGFVKNIVENDVAPASVSELRGMYKETASLDILKKFASYLGEWELTDADPWKI